MGEFLNFQSRLVEMPVYKYFGYPAKFHGKPLFHILCHLKVLHPTLTPSPPSPPSPPLTSLTSPQEFGKGRIVTRTSHLAEAAHPALPSFYRILWAQVRLVCWGPALTPALPRSP